MIELPLETVPDPDDPRLALTFVSVEVNGALIRALLDTGAGRSSLVQRPGLSITSEAPDASVGAFGLATTERRTTAAVRFAGSDLGMIEFSVVPPGHPGHGDLIGQDVLTRFRCEYRLAERRLRLNGDLPDGAAPIYLDAKRHVYLDATWPATTFRASAVFDTGASVTVVDQAFYVAYPELFTITGTSHGTDASGVTVETPMAMMRGPVLLRRAMSESPVAIVDLDRANGTLERRMDLILGWPIIQQAAWVIDHAEQVGASSPLQRAQSLGHTQPAI